MQTLHEKQRHQHSGREALSHSVPIHLVHLQLDHTAVHLLLLYESPSSVSLLHHHRVSVVTMATIVSVSVSSQTAQIGSSFLVQADVVSANGMTGMRGRA